MREVEYPVGSSRTKSWVGLGWVGLGWVGLGQVGSGKVEPDQFSRISSVESSRVELGLVSGKVGSGCCMKT